MEKDTARLIEDALELERRKVIKLLWRLGPKEMRNHVKELIEQFKREEK
jgi:hypothetical protein